MREERIDINILKGMSILAVVLYHFGILDTGYLGVDVFFVVNGYLIIPSLVEQISINESFKYFDFLKKRIKRLMPLVVIACIVCLSIGAIGMLPHDYEVISVMIISALSCTINFLQYLTTKDYWAVANNYRPLMHLWYLGVLVQFYITFPIILMGVKKVCKIVKRDSYEKILWIVCGLLFVISVILFFCPVFSQFIKFYMLPFRVYEIILGGLVGFCANKYSLKDIKYTTNIKNILWMLLLIVLYFGFITYNGDSLINNLPNVRNEVNNFFLKNALSIFLTIIITSFILFFDNKNSQMKAPLINFMGKMSYSMYIWHQIIIAFYRYYINGEYKLLQLIICSITIFILSFISYIYFEKKQYDFFIKKISILLVLLIIVSSVVYIKEGIIRDVPELDIYISEKEQEDSFEYVDRIYEYDKEFVDDIRYKVLVVGNSFARDWSNILLESEFEQYIQLSYSYNWSEKLLGRLEQCDYLFVSNRSKDEIPKYVWEYLDEKRVYAIGTKSYGYNMGNIYSKRFREDYYEQVVEIDKSYYELNEAWKESWGEDNFIDLLEYVSMPDGKIRIFTDEQKFISADAIHLTKAGAKYYAKVIDMYSIFNIDNFLE